MLAKYLSPVLLCSPDASKRMNLRGSPSLQNYWPRRSDKEFLHPLNKKGFGVFAFKDITATFKVSLWWMRLSDGGQAGAYH